MTDPSPLSPPILLTEEALDAAADPPTAPPPPPPPPPPAALRLEEDELVVEGESGLDLSITPDTVEEAGGFDEERLAALPPDLHEVRPEERG